MLELEKYQLESIFDPCKFAEICEDFNLVEAWVLFCELCLDGQNSDIYRAGCILGEVFSPGAGWKSDPCQHDEEVREALIEIVNANLSHHEITIFFKDHNLVRGCHAQTG